MDIDFSSRMVNFVEEGFDFAIRYGELADSSLIARKLVNRSMMAAASEAYLNKKGAPASPSQLKHHDCIVSTSDVWKFDCPSGQESIKVRGRWRHNTNVVVMACEAGLGVAYMPISSFKKSIAMGRVHPVLEPYWGQGAQ